jgi:hypothetical protein
LRPNEAGILEDYGQAVLAEANLYQLYSSYEPDKSTSIKSGGIENETVKYSGMPASTLVWKGTIGNDWVDTKLEAYPGQTLRIYPGDGLLTKIGDNAIVVPTEIADSMIIGAVYCNAPNPYRETWKFQCLTDNKVVEIYQVN